MPDPLLDRQQELAAIDGLLDRARDGAGGAVAFVGPAGIGRTALLARARELATRRGFTILTARGVPHERELAFGVARQALERRLAKRVRALLLEGGGSLHASLLGLHGALTGISECEPTLLVVDDAQWADDPTLQWLAFTTLRLAGTSVALVAAARSGEPRSLRALEDGGGRVLRPRPLGGSAIVALLRARTGREPTPELVLACRAATGGNPFLVTELAAALGRGPHASPRLERFVAGRLSTLAPDARRLAEGIALLGPATELRDAAALAGIDEERAAAAADALRGSELLAPGGGLRFAEPLVAQTVYAALPPGRRALMHSRAARLARRRGVAARHLLASPPGADPWAAQILRLEAERALARGATAGAVKLLRRAAREAVGVGRAELLAALGTAEVRIGSPEAVRHLGAARRLALDAGGAERLAPQLARSLLSLGRAEEAVALADGADACAPDVRTRLEAELYAGARLMPGFGRRIGARAALHERTLPACAAAELACRGINADGTAALAGSAPLAPASAEQAIACHVLIWCDRLTQARAWLDAAAGHARRHGAVAELARIAALRAELELRAGALAAAEAHARQGGGRARAWLALALLERGDDGQAAKLLEHVSELEAPPAALRFARGRVRVVQHDLDGAVEDLVEAGATLLRDRVPGPAVLPWRAEAALALAARGDVAEAERQAREEYRLARRFGAPRPLGLALLALAAAGGRAVRIERCREAVAVLGRGEARLDHAQALCDLGGALRRSGARREAREPLRAALDAATRLGAAALATRAREELNATGARPRRAVQSGRESLTPAELRVVALAARGLANREIARALFLTVKTIETELGHAYAKLGIRSRRELPGALGA
jgi:DNA-binding CsgD family transcriptional regulator